MCVCVFTCNQRVLVCKVYIIAQYHRLSTLSRLSCVLPKFCHRKRCERLLFLMLFYMLGWPSTDCSLCAIFAQLPSCVVHSPAFLNVPGPSCNPAALIRGKLEEAVESFARSYNLEAEDNRRTISE